MSKTVGVTIDGAATRHAHGVSQDFATLCGIDADDPSVGHGGVITAPRGQKITCTQCHTLWMNTIALRLTAKDFSPED
jgi:hypothetical protein